MGCTCLPFVPKNEKTKGVGEIAASYPQIAGAESPGGFGTIQIPGDSPRSAFHRSGGWTGSVIFEVFQIILKDRQAWEAVGCLAEVLSALTFWGPD